MIHSTLPWKPNKQRKKHNIKTSSFICSSHVLSSPYDVAPIAYNAHNYEAIVYENDNNNDIRVLEEVIWSIDRLS